MRITETNAKIWLFLSLKLKQTEGIETSRAKLAKELSLTENRVRTALNQLEEEKLIVRKKYCHSTKISFHPDFSENHQLNHGINHKVNPPEPDISENHQLNHKANHHFNENPDFLVRVRTRARMPGRFTYHTYLHLDLPILSTEVNSSPTAFDITSEWNLKNISYCVKNIKKLNPETNKNTFSLLASFDRPAKKTPENDLFFHYSPFSGCMKYDIALIPSQTLTEKNHKNLVSFFSKICASGVKYGGNRSILEEENIPLLQETSHSNQKQQKVNRIPENRQQNA